MTTKAEYEAAKAIVDEWMPGIDDIQPPVLPEYPAWGPAAFGVTVRGTELVIVNWQDFKGWEVRRRAQNSYVPTPTLGYIRGHGGNYVHVTRGGEVETQVETFGRALLYLLGRSA